jgi:hypothetical protein
MTNKEYIIEVLSDEYNDPFDDGGASFEALVHYHINCPYLCGDERAHCHNKPLDYSNDRKHCVACKLEWLDMEVDT